MLCVSSKQGLREQIQREAVGDGETAVGDFSPCSSWLLLLCPATRDQGSFQIRRVGFCVWTFKMNAVVIDLVVEAEAHFVTEGILVDATFHDVDAFH